MQEICGTRKRTQPSHNCRQVPYAPDCSAENENSLSRRTENRHMCDRNKGLKYGRDTTTSPVSLQTPEPGAPSVHGSLEGTPATSSSRALRSRRIGRSTSSGSDRAYRDRRPVLPDSQLGLGSSLSASHPAHRDGVVPPLHRVSWATHARPSQ